MSGTVYSYTTYLKALDARKIQEEEQGGRGGDVELEKNKRNAWRSTPIVDKWTGEKIPVHGSNKIATEDPETDVLKLTRLITDRASQKNAEPRIRDRDRGRSMHTGDDSTVSSLTWLDNDADTLEDPAISDDEMDDHEQEDENNRDASSPKEILPDKQLPVGKGKHKGQKGEGMGKKSTVAGVRGKRRWRTAEKKRQQEQGVQIRTVPKNPIARHLRRQRIEQNKLLGSMLEEISKNILEPLKREKNEDVELPEMPIDHPAVALHARGMELATAGCYELALSLFKASLDALPPLQPIIIQTHVKLTSGDIQNTLSASNSSGNLNLALGNSATGSSPSVEKNSESKSFVQACVYLRLRILSDMIQYSAEMHEQSVENGSMHSMYSSVYTAGASQTQVNEGSDIVNLLRQSREAVVRLDVGYFHKHRLQAVETAFVGKIALALLTQGKLEESLKSFEEMVNRASAVNESILVTSADSNTNCRLKWLALFGKANALVQLGQFSNALPTAISALETARKTSDPKNIAGTLGLVARCTTTLSEGNVTELRIALALLVEQSQVLTSAVHADAELKLALAGCYLSTASVYYDLGEWQSALHALQDRQKILQSMEDPAHVNLLTLECEKCETLEWFGRVQAQLSLGLNLDEPFMYLPFHPPFIHTYTHESIDVRSTHVYTDSKDVCVLPVYELNELMIGGTLLNASGFGSVYQLQNSMKTYRELEAGCEACAVYFRTLLEFSEKVPDSMALNYYRNAFVYQSKLCQALQDYNTAYELLKEAINVSKDMGEDIITLELSVRAETMRLLGTTRCSTDDQKFMLADVISNLSALLVEARTSSKIIIEITCRSVLGWAYYAAGDYNAALQEFQSQDLLSQSKRNLSSGCGVAYMCTAHCHYQMAANMLQECRLLSVTEKESLHERLSLAANSYQAYFKWAQAKGDVISEAHAHMCMAYTASLLLAGGYKEEVTDIAESVVLMHREEARTLYTSICDVHKLAIIMSDDIDCNI